MYFEILGDIRQIETFASGRGIRELARLQKAYGWTRILAQAQRDREVRLPDGTVRLAEIHWYEASGIGQKEFKIKRFLD